MKKREGTKISYPGMAFCVLASVLVICPLLYVLIVSVSNQKALNKNLFSFIYDFHPENYAAALEEGNIGRFILNTVVICVITNSIVIYAGSRFAFATKLYNKFREIDIMYYILMTGMFVPVQTIVLPLLKLIKAIHLLNHPLGLALVYAGTNLPLSMMMFAGYYKTIPADLVEAAMIDGCSPYRAFYRVVFPITKPIVCTVVILTSLNIWRDMFIPLMLTTDVNARTVAYGLMSFVNEFSLDWTVMCAAMVIITLPIIILYLCLQKYFIRGAVTGAVKG